MSAVVGELSYAPGSLVRARGREWIVMPGSEGALLRLRPLTGAEQDSTMLDAMLEFEPVVPASFPVPTAGQRASQESALLLRDALLMSLRRGAGPFRSFGHLAFEPRTYQLVPLLMALKLLEMRSPRDYYVVTFLGYFLVVTNFFYSQTIPTALYMLGVVVGATTVLIQYNTPPDYRHTRGMLRLSAAMTAQAVPLMLLAFVLFPRIPGPLWGLPQDAFDAVTGLSDTMTIGEITRLGMSNEIAFRVQFHGAEPRSRARYWRGPVLWHSDGRTWSAAAFADGPTPV